MSKICSRWSCLILSLYSALFAAKSTPSFCKRPSNKQACKVCQGCQECLECPPFKVIGPEVVLNKQPATICKGSSSEREGQTSSSTQVTTRVITSKEDKIEDMVGSQAAKSINLTLTKGSQCPCPVDPIKVATQKWILRISRPLVLQPLDLKVVRKWFTKPKNLEEKTVNRNLMSMLAVCKAEEAVAK